MAERFVREALSDINLIYAVDQIITQLVGDILYLHFRITNPAGHSQEFHFEKVIA